MNFQKSQKPGFLNSTYIIEVICFDLSFSWSDRPMVYTPYAPRWYVFWGLQVPSVAFFQVLLGCVFMFLPKCRVCVNLIKLVHVGLVYVWICLPRISIFKRATSVSK